MPTQIRTVDEDLGSCPDCRHGRVLGITAPHKGPDYFYGKCDNCGQTFLWDVYNDTYVRLGKVFLASLSGIDLLLENRLVSPRNRGYGAPSATPVPKTGPRRLVIVRKREEYKGTGLRRGEDGALHQIAKETASSAAALAETKTKHREPDGGNKKTQAGRSWHPARQAAAALRRTTDARDFLTGYYTDDDKETAYD